MNTEYTASELEDGIPVVTPEEQLQWAAAEEASAEEYDFTASADEIAKKRGQIVIWPIPNELQIDIDSAEQWGKFRERFEQLGWCYEWTRVHNSRSGPNRFHVYIRHPKREFTTPERLMYQAALNDDPVRVWLNALRYNEGVDTPSRLFEFPDFNIDSGVQVHEVVITPQAAKCKHDIAMCDFCARCLDEAEMRRS